LNQFSHDYNIQLTPQAKAWLVEKNYSKEFGARPLIRALDDNVLGLLARLDLREEFIKNVDRLLVDLKQDQSGLSFFLIHPDGTQVDLNDI
jgi:ATP-dependent Clp protease ATP-binding subunit ClpA